MPVRRRPLPRPRAGGLHQRPVGCALRHAGRGVLRHDRLWADSTTSRTYDTVNAVKGQPGGSIDGLGPAIAGGMVYTMSGFNGASNTGGNGVNVLLAYSVDGK